MAGAGDTGLVKCLHSHMAWFLVHPDYLAGKAIADKVGELWCPDERCASWMAEIHGNQSESSGNAAP